jgi:hypothetical protein
MAPSPSSSEEGENRGPGSQRLSEIRQEAKDDDNDRIGEWEGYLGTEAW